MSIQAAPREEPKAPFVALPSPGALRDALPAGSELAGRIAAGRKAIADALHGRDPDRLVVVTGPCSIHDPRAALEYAERLAEVARREADCLIVVMRTYFEKPRTRIGWKGLLTDPRADGSHDLSQGLETARGLLLDVARSGLPCGSELLDPLAPAYLSDLLAWACIGARTTASQTHRELASALPCPVGMKNPLDGDLAVAFDAVAAVQAPHHFLSIDDAGVCGVRHSAGNPDAHVVLRGGDGPNYDAATLARARRLGEQEGLARPLLVDCSHGNSGKDHRRQGDVCRSVLAEFRAGRRGILGVMLESHLRPGRQPLDAGRLEYGVSVTDACIGWEETEALLGEAADTVRAVRGGGRGLSG